MAVVALVLALVLIAVLSVSNVNSLINAETQLPSSGSNTVAWYWSSEFQPAVEIGRDARRHERGLHDDCDFEPGRRSCVLCRARLARDSVDVGHTRIGAAPRGPSDRERPDRRRHALRNPPQEGRHERGLRLWPSTRPVASGRGVTSTGPCRPSSTTTTTSTTVPTAVKPSELSTPPGVKFTSVSVGFDFALALDSKRPRLGLGQQRRGQPRSGDAFGCCAHTHRSGDTARASHSVRWRPAPSSRSPWIRRGRCGTGGSTRVAISGWPTAKCPPVPVPCRAITTGLCTSTPLAVAFPPGVRVTAIAAGDDEDAAALDSSGRIWTWGSSA